MNEHNKKNFSDETEAMRNLSMSMRKYKKNLLRIIISYLNTVFVT
jgi:hypothetical protein